MREWLYRLTLQVGDDLYDLAPDGAGDWRLVKFTGKGRGPCYRLYRLPSGEWRCDCPDSTSRGRASKHVTACAEVGILAGMTPAQANG
jgi:hypothetical protein